MNKIYLDNAATTPLSKDVIEAMLPFMENFYGNPSSTHSHGREVRAAIENARKKIAELLNVTPGEIFFTSGGTEADNMALRCSVQQMDIQHIITSPIEHHAVLHTVEELAQTGKVQLHFVKLLPDGHLDLADLERLLQNHPKALVSLMYGNNEIGNLMDFEKVSELCNTYHAIFHCDTVQAVAHYPIDLNKTKVHFIAGAAHKFNGPKGIGFIYINREIKMKPLMTGGSQERNMRGGTENVYGIIGLAKAMEICYSKMEQKTNHILGLKNYMMEKLEKDIPGVKFNGDAKGKSLYTVLSVSFPPSSINEMLLFKLDILGISASGGSACSSGTDVGSHVMQAIGVEKGRGNVRFSFGPQNTKEEIDFVVDNLKEFYLS